MLLTGSHAEEALTATQMAVVWVVEAGDTMVVGTLVKDAIQ